MLFRHDAPGTAGTAVAVPEFFHCLVGFSWRREKFYFLYVSMNLNWKFQAKRLIHKDLFMIIALFVSLA